MKNAILYKLTEQGLLDTKNQTKPCKKINQCASEKIGRWPVLIICSKGQGKITQIQKNFNVKVASFLSVVFEWELVEKVMFSKNLILEKLNLSANIFFK